MRKIVINKCYGGFSVSEKALKHMKDNGWEEPEDFFNGRGMQRDDPHLVAAVEALGDKASGAVAALEIVEIPNDVEWEIEEYEGSEWVSEVHRTWY